MEKAMETLRAEMNDKLLRKEEQINQLKNEIKIERIKNGEQAFKLRQIASARLTVSDVLSAVASLNQSTNLKIDEIGDDVNKLKTHVEDVVDDVDRVDGEHRNFLDKFGERLANVEQYYNDTAKETTNAPAEELHRATDVKLQAFAQELKNMQLDVSKLTDSITDHVFLTKIVTTRTNENLNNLDEKVENQSKRIQELETRTHFMEKELKGNFSLLKRIHLEVQNLSRQTFSLEKRSKNWDSFRDELGTAIDKVREKVSYSDHGFRSDAPDNTNNETVADRPNAPQSLIMVPKEKVNSPFSPTCTLDVSAFDNIIANIDGRPIEDATIDHGKTVTFRCRDIGMFQFHGSVRRKCEVGTWTGNKPRCERLLSLQEVKSNMFGVHANSTPSIIFETDSKHSGISPMGDLIISPGSRITLACIFPGMLGTLQWKVNSGTKDRYMVGEWSSTQNDLRSGRSSPPFRYEIKLSSAQPENSGLYTCSTSRRQSHSIRLTVKDVRCSYPLFREMVRATEPIETTVNSIIHLRCLSPQLHLQWRSGIKSDSSMRCLPSGVWSRDFPICSKFL